MQENKTVLFTREHKTLYAQGDKVIKVFDSNYKKIGCPQRGAQ